MAHQYTSGQLCLAVNLASASKKLELFLCIFFQSCLCSCIFSPKRKQLVTSFWLLSALLFNEVKYVETPTDLQNIENALKGKSNMVFAYVPATGTAGMNS